MNERFEEAVEEFKRVDHLIFVSLKYTRTVDVFRSIIERLIDTLRLGIDSLLEHAKEQGRLSAIPPSPKLRTEELKKLYGDDAMILELIAFYLKLRRLQRAPFTRSNEFRRHVTMTSTLDNGEVVMNTIDTIEVHYQKAKDILSFIKERLQA